ncbi:MAG: hypothetical protein HY471_01245 [Candidatus Sungbacteria bacterium]|nr:hypothetical protein [Candidatus Sungbacteria bacterium]
MHEFEYRGWFRRTSRGIVFVFFTLAIPLRRPPDLAIEEGIFVPSHPEVVMATPIRHDYFPGVVTALLNEMVNQKQGPLSAYNVADGDFYPIPAGKPVRIPLNEVYVGLGMPSRGILLRLDAPNHRLGVTGHTQFDKKPIKNRWQNTPHVTKNNIVPVDCSHPVNRLCPPHLCLLPRLLVAY